MVVNIWFQAQDEFAFDISVQRPFQLMPGIPLVVLILEYHLILTIHVHSNFYFFKYCYANLGGLTENLSFSIKTENQGPPSVIKLMPTLLCWIKVSKVNSEKKHNLKLGWSSWEIHLWYLLFELFSSHSTSPCRASSSSSSPCPSPSPSSSSVSPSPSSSSSSPSSFPAILSGKSTVWARIWD